MTADIRAYVKNTEEIVISNKKTMVANSIGRPWTKSYTRPLYTIRRDPLSEK